MPKFATEVHSPALPLIVPAAAVLVTLGLFWHTITVGSAGDHSVFQPAPIMAENAQVPGLPSRDAGTLDASFTVTAGWIENLSALVGRPNGQDVQGLAAHNGFNVGGAPSQANGVWVVSLLPAAQVPQFLVAAETGRGPAKMKLASSANEPVGIQNLAAADFPTVIFPPNSTAVPSRSIPLLRRAAMQLKQLPSGTLVQLNGYTHSMRMSANDVKLSQQRADSVYRILVREGVSPAMLSAKGYGSTESLASTDRIAEGRSTNEAKGGPQADRRVEFRIIPPRQ